MNATVTQAGTNASSTTTPADPVDATKVSVTGTNSVTVTFGDTIKEGNVVTVVANKVENAEDSTNKVAETTITIEDGKAVIDPAP